MNKIFLLSIVLILSSCSTDFPRTTIATAGLNGFIEGGSAAGLYGASGLKITSDSIRMTDWPVSRLVSSLNKVRDTTLQDLTGTTAVYTIQIANIDSLPPRDFVDSLIVEFTKAKLIK